MTVPLVDLVEVVVLLVPHQGVLVDEVDDLVGLFIAQMKLGLLHPRCCWGLDLCGGTPLRGLAGGIVIGGFCTCFFIIITVAVVC